MNVTTVTVARDAKPVPTIILAIPRNPEEIVNFVIAVTTPISKGLGTVIPTPENVFNAFTIPRARIVNFVKQDFMGTL